MGLVTTARAQRNATLAALTSAQLSDLIEEASAAIERWCGRTFASTSYTESQVGQGFDYIDVDQWPITAVTSVVITYRDGDTDTITDLTYEANTGRIRIDLSADPAPEVTVFPRSWAASSIHVASNDLVPNLTVTYTAGYSSIPYDVQRACILTMLAMNSAENRDPAMQSENLGDYSYTIAQGDAGSPLPLGARSLLSSYRRFAVA